MSARSAENDFLSKLRPIERLAKKYTGKKPKQTRGGYYRDRPGPSAYAMSETDYTQSAKRLGRKVILCNSKGCMPITPGEAIVLAEQLRAAAKEIIERDVQAG